MAKGKQYSKRGTTSLKSGKFFKSGKKKFSKKSKYGTSYKKIEYTQPEVKALQNYGLKVIRPVPIHSTTHKNQYKVEQQTVVENGQRTCLMKTWNCEPLRFDLDLISQGVMDGQRIGNKIFVRWLTLNMKIKCSPNYTAGFIKFLVLRNKQATIDFFSSDHINQTKSLAYLDYSKYRVEEEIIIPLKSDVKLADDSKTSFNQNKALVPTVHVLERKWKVMSSIEYGPTGSVSSTGHYWSSGEKRDQRYSLAEAKELLAGSANGSLSIPTIFFGNMQELNSGIVSANSQGVKTETEYLESKKKNKEFEEMVESMKTFVQLPGEHLQRKINDGITLTNFSARVDPGIQFPNNVVRGPYKSFPTWTHIRYTNDLNENRIISRDALTAYITVASANISQNFERAHVIGGLRYEDNNNNLGSMYYNSLTNGFGDGSRITQQVVGNQMENENVLIERLATVLLHHVELIQAERLTYIQQAPSLHDIQDMKWVHQWLTQGDDVDNRNWADITSYGLLAVNGNFETLNNDALAKQIKANVASWAINPKLERTFVNNCLDNVRTAGDQFIGSLIQPHGLISKYERYIGGGYQVLQNDVASYTASVGHFLIKFGGMVGLIPEDPYLQDIQSINNPVYECGLSYMNSSIIEPRIPPLQNTINRMLNALDTSVENFQENNLPLSNSSNYIEYVALINAQNQQVRESTNTVILTDKEKDDFNEANVQVEYAWNVSYTDT